MTIAISLRPLAAPIELGSFVHPGILHTSADLDRMRKCCRIAGSPIAAGFEKLRTHPFSQSDYKPHAFSAEIGRNPSVNFRAFDDDCNAAYQCSLMAAITGEARHAQVARSILMGWSGSLEKVSGADAVLMAGLGPFKWINAAEILRALRELDDAAVTECAAMLRRAILPAIIDFAPFANGNWDTAAIKTMMAIAVFSDDRPLFERALLYCVHGDGDGQLTHYIYDNGQCQESGRDQQHTQLGLGHLGDACQIAWNQGLDLYGAFVNRLLRGFEYTAAYNLGENVEFAQDVDRTGKYRHQVISPRGELRPIYEQIFAHYHVSRGMPAPWVEKAVAKLRPEGAAQGADHTGFGTLLYALDEAAAPVEAVAAAPAALYASEVENGIRLEWLRPREGPTYSVERAGNTGSFKTIAAKVKDAEYVDSSVRGDEFYRYHVRAENAKSLRSESAAVEIANGLPRGWTQTALGDPSTSGQVTFDGRVLTIVAAGRGLLDGEEEGRLVYLGLPADSVSLRFLQGTASQFAQFGLTCRSSSVANATLTGIIVFPAQGDRERSGWSIRFFARSEDGNVDVVRDFSLPPPVVQYGRLMSSVYLWLERRAGSIAANCSLDGITWRSMGNGAEVVPGRMGIVASSGIAGVDSAMRCDSIAVDGIQLALE